MPGTRAPRQTDVASRPPSGALVAIGLLAWLGAPNAPADAPPTLAIRAAHIETVGGETIESGTIVVADGRIEAVGTGVEVPEGAELIDVGGGTVVPGFVNPFTGLGISSGGSGKPASNPQYRVADELYPFQDAYKLAARAGFTTLALCNRAPGVAGQAALIRTVSDSAEDMLISDRGPLTINFSANTETKDVVKGALETGAKGSGGKDAALAWAVNGQIPTLLRCASTGDVVHALALLEPHKDMQVGVVCGTSDLERLTGDLAEAQMPVAFPATISFERFTRKRISLPRILTEAGIRVACLPRTDNIDGYESFRNSVAELVRGRLTRHEALQAMTLHPAQMLGLDCRLGSIEAGKDANLVVLDGDVFDPRAKILRTLIEGVTVYDAAWGGIR